LEALGLGVDNSSTEDSNSEVNSEEKGEEKGGNKDDVEGQVANTG
jgi:hypothetical protein